MAATTKFAESPDADTLAKTRYHAARDDDILHFGVGLLLSSSTKIAWTVKFRPGL
jgi:hypothetical protein